MAARWGKAVALGGPVVDGSAEGVDEQAAGPAYAYEVVEQVKACGHVVCSG